MLGIFDLKFVKDSRIVQISGKILIASSNAIDGVMNSHAIVRSERPRTRLASRDGVVPASRSPTVSMPRVALISIHSLRCRGPRRESAGDRMSMRLELAFVLEHFGPVLDEQ